MKKLLVFFLLFCMLFLNGCIEKNDLQTTSNVNKDYIIYNIGKLPTDLSSFNGDNTRKNDLWLAIFEGLVKTDLKGNIIPGIAENWTVSKDGLIYKFKIRDDAAWSNGNSITSTDFTDFFKYILKDNINSEYSNQLYCVFGAEDYSKGKKDFSEVAISAIDRQDIEFRLNSPNSNFLNILSQPYFSLRDTKNNMKTWNTNYMNINYTGPFKIANVSLNGVISLVKNNLYWDNTNVLLHKLIFTTIDGCEEALANFETQKIDVMVDPPLSEVERLIESKKAFSSPTNILNSFGFNMKSKNIVSDLNFRKAVKLAISINKNVILKNSLNDILKSAEAFVPSIDSNKDEVVKSEVNPSENIAQAKTFLTQSKYKEETIKLVYLSSTENDRICQAFKKSIHDSLGVNVNCISYNYDDFKKIVQSGDYDIVKTEDTDFFSDETSFLQRWTSNSIYNINGYKNPDYDLLLTKINNEKDKSKKNAYIQSAENILNNDIPEIPFYYSNLVICKNNNITGIDITNKGNLIFTKAVYNN